MNITDEQVRRARAAAALKRRVLEALARESAKAAAEQAKDDRASNAIRRHLPETLR